MSRKLLFSFLIFSCSVMGCGYPRLRVQTLCVRPHELASYRVGTPDPRHICPDIGQKLVVKWAVPPGARQCGEPMLHLTVRFGCGEECFMLHPLQTTHGTMIYPLLNEDYFEKGGIQAAKVEVFAGEEWIAGWRHQLWEDRLEI